MKQKEKWNFKNDENREAKNKTSNDFLRSGTKL